jgi:hypothetical protein
VYEDAADHEASVRIEPPKKKDYRKEGTSQTEVTVVPSAQIGLDFNVPSHPSSYRNQWQVKGTTRV